MAQRGPLVTAVVVVGGLVGLMTANASGGLVTAGNTTPDQENVAATGTTAPVTTTEPPAPPVTTTEPPPPPASTTTEPPAPRKPAFPAEAVYAGRAADSPLAIAVAVKGDEAAAYLCDGANVESWLKGTASEGTLELKSKDGATTLTGELVGANLNGTITVAGQPQQFSIAPASAPAGLYRGDGDATTLGWILLPDGTQVGIARSASGTAPAPPLDPAKGAVTVRGERVGAEKVSGQTRFG
ncbi:hypothetical protein [Actinophytocola glycyrrhizae]|uniref:Serine/threonine protein kinase n=1 Tax=Actinophytocola glycyrrhizae TaxID=2044873 RepID=A0ABV9S656_9PSEU